MRQGFGQTLDWEDDGIWAKFGLENGVCKPPAPLHDSLIYNLPFIYNFSLSLLPNTDHVLKS